MGVSHLTITSLFSAKSAHNTNWDQLYLLVSVPHRLLEIEQGSPISDHPQAMACVLERLRSLRSRRRCCHCQTNLKLSELLLSQEKREKLKITLSFPIITYLRYLLYNYLHGSILTELYNLKEMFSWGYFILVFKFEVPGDCRER